MNHFTLQRFVFLAVLLGVVTPAGGYELWLGCTKIPRTAATRPELWMNVRGGITGTNLNLTGFNKRDLTKPVVKGEQSMGRKDWQKFFAGLSPDARRGLFPIPRSQIENKDRPDRPTIEEKLEMVFGKNHKNFGYEIGGLMPYSSRVNENKKFDPIDFSTEELARIRRWLNTHQRGRYRDVKIVENIRLFRKKEFLDGLNDRGKLIDAYLFEAAPDKFYEDRGNRKQMLKTFLTDPRLTGKDIIFQIPIGSWKHEHEKGANNYEMLRHFIVWLGDNFGHEFLRSDRVKILITTYYPTIPFYPELSPDGRQYQNTMTGIILSLIEQEPLFTGMLKNSDGSPHHPTKNDAYNAARVPMKSPQSQTQPTRSQRVRSSR